MRDRIVNALWGAFIGDALGMPSHGGNIRAPAVSGNKVCPFMIQQQQRSLQ
jgi:ADP-ribosylglycohydrolase